MSYILNLRQKVGHDPLISTGAATLVYNASAQLLFVYRSDTHLWGLPSGSKEIGEQLEDTAIREVLEETGVHASRLRFETILSGPDMQFVYPNGDEIDAVIAVYQDSPKIPRFSHSPVKLKKSLFFNLEQLPDAMTAFTHQILEACHLV